MKHDLDKAAKEYVLNDEIKPWRSLCEEAFRAGAHWAMNTLCRSAKELPSRVDDRIIVVNEGTVTSTTYENYVHGCGKFNPERWCYVSDILNGKDE